MSLARKVFLGVFGAGLLLGLLIGAINLVAPDAVSVTWNDENVEGLGGLGVGLFSGGLPGLIFGLVAGGVTKLFTRSRKTA